MQHTTTDIPTRQQVTPTYATIGVLALLAILRFYVFPIPPEGSLWNLILHPSSILTETGFPYAIYTLLTGIVVGALMYSLLSLWSKASRSLMARATVCVAAAAMIADLFYPKVSPMFIPIVLYGLVAGITAFRLYLARRGVTVE